MPQDPNLEKPNINPEIQKTTEAAVEQSLDSQKMEQMAETESRNAEKMQEDSQTSPIIDDSIGTTKNVQSDFELVHKNVENVLAEGMDNVFLSLDAGVQKAFKLKGEEVSRKITNLLMKAKIKAQEISNLILEWLRIIPRVNKHYIEQEAKIKTEKILKIKENK